MKIAFDIGHPAHVHYFKNIIYILKKNNFKIYISARDKEITHLLLKELNLSYYNRGKGANNIISKIINIPITDIKLYFYFKDINPDLFLSFGSFYLSHVAKLLNKPCIILDDTEHAYFGQFLYKKFTDVIITPKFFKRIIDKNKQLKINAFFEQLYLDKDFFIQKSKKELSKYISFDRKNILIRFVSWNALHDKKQKRLSLKQKKYLIEKLQKHGNIYISSEETLPDELAKYELTANKKDIHSIMSHMDLFISESGTMTTESALLGIPTIFSVDPQLAKKFGNFQMLLRYKLIKVEFEIDKILNLVPIMLENDYKEKINLYKNKLWDETDNINQYLINIIKKELSIDIAYYNTCKK